MADLEITNRTPTWGELILVAHCKQGHLARDPEAVLHLIVARTNLDVMDVATMDVEEVIDTFNKVLAEMVVGMRVAKISMQLGKDGE